MNKTNVVVLCGGAISSEREISLHSAENTYEVCQKLFPTKLVTLKEDFFPTELCRDKSTVIFPLTHGEFGEDGRLQALMEAAGATFIGSNSKASAICMDKFSSKEIAKSANIPCARGIKFSKKNLPNIDNLIKKFGNQLVIKPNAKGSSVDTHMATSKDDLHNIFENLDENTEYLLEEKITGIDLTIGILDGKALEVVEILPKHGFYDFHNKYTTDATKKICPAQIPLKAAENVKIFSEKMFKLCGCRDWARADFMLNNNGEAFFLEMNTIPGMTETSLFPISAKATGIEFPQLIEKMVETAACRCKN